jgi:CHAT domain-containing protein/tetratricopeptide (TPR) repeat protein
MTRLHTTVLLLAAMLGVPLTAGAAGFALPPSCAAVTTPPDDKTSLRELRKRVEAENETDPTAAFAILCTSIPRAAAEYGEQSPQFAWWAAALATPLIAYMDKFDEALPVLEFAQPILERRYGRYGEPLGDIHVAYAWTYFRQGRLAESGAAWTEALKVRERSPGKKKIELQKVLVGLAQVQLAQRDFAGAERNLGRAHEILVQNHDTVSEAGAAIESALVAVAFRQERFEEARRHAEETLRIEHQLRGGAAQLVPAYALLGRILERLDEYEQAEAALRRAVELAEGAKGPLQRHHFSALYQLAVLLDDRNRAAEAREQAARALSIGEATLGPTAPRLVPVLQVLGDAEHQLGQLPEALHHFERAGAIIAAGKDNVERSWLVDYYRDLGALQMSLGDAPAAKSTLTAGLEAADDDPTLAVERAWLLFEQSRAQAEVGVRGNGELLQAAALLRSKIPESHPAILRVLNELCEIELATPAAAPNCAESAQRVERAHDTAPDLRAAIYDNQSRLASERSDGTAARSFAVRAVAAAESTGTPEPLWQAYFQLATVLRERQETALAIFFGKQALAQIERERSHFVGADRRFDIGFLRDKVAVYRSVADWLLESGRIEEGLAVLQLMKSEELTDFGVRDASLAPERSALLTDEEEALRSRYFRAVQPDSASASELSRLSALDEAGKISPAERARLQTLLAGAGETEDARAARIEQLLHGTAGSDVAGQPRTRAISAPALAQTALSFGPDTAFAVYLMTDQHLRILVSARDAQAEFLIPIDGPQLKRDIGHFLDDIAQRRDVTGLSNRLYEVIARPVDEFAAQRHAHRLVLWLDGSLRYVPIAALQDGRRYLIDKYVIQLYTPPFDANREPRRAAQLEVRGFGVTQAIAGFPALPAVADELCYVVRGPIEGLHSSSVACAGSPRTQGALQGEGFADTAFTGQRFKELLAGPRDFSVLHVGTHFRLRPGNALRSYLLLGDGSKLTLDALSALDFNAIDLVTLSACETGMGGANSDDGREVEGLSTLVQRRGAGRVIATLWQVEDASTAQLMRRLYTAFSATHGDAALGLQQAQRALRSLTSPAGTSYANPYYWAGFTLAGSRP